MAKTLARVCPRCHKPLKPNASRCRACGATFDPLFAPMAGQPSDSPIQVEQSAKRNSHPAPAGQSVPTRRPSSEPGVGRRTTEPGMKNAPPRNAATTAPNAAVSSVSEPEPAVSDPYSAATRPTAAAPVFAPVTYSAAEPPDEAVHSAYVVTGRLEPEPNKKGHFATVTLLGWIGILLLLLIPGVNIVMLMIWAIAAKKYSKRNFARAVLIFLFFAIIAFLLLWLFTGTFWQRYLDLLYYYW
jgi:hypothetical protein